MAWYKRKNGDMVYANEEGRFVGYVSCFTSPQYLADIIWPQHIFCGSWISVELAKAAVEEGLFARSNPSFRNPILFRKFGPLSEQPEGRLYWAVLDEDGRVIAKHWDEESARRNADLCGGRVEMRFTQPGDDMQGTGL